MIFRTGGKDYRGATAVEVARALERDAADYPYPGQTIRQFLLWSLNQLRDHAPPRELDLSGRLDDEARYYRVDKIDVLVLPRAVLIAKGKDGKPRVLPLNRVAQNVFTILVGDTVTGSGFSPTIRVSR